MNKDISFGGLTTVPSDYECADGDLAAVLNLVPEDGSLKPVQPPTTLATFPEDGMRVVFIHKINSALTYYIVEDLQRESNGCLAATKDFKEYKDFDDCVIYSKVIGIQAIGNVMSVLTEDDFFYLRYEADKDKYKKVSADFPNLDISFGLAGTLLSKGYEDTGATWGEVTSSDLTYEEIVYNGEVTTKSVLTTDVSLESGGTYRVTHALNAMFKKLEIRGTNESGTEELITTATNTKWSFSVSKTYTNINFTLYSQKGYYSCVITLYKASQSSSELGSYALDNNTETYNAVLGCANKFLAEVKEDNKFIYPFFVRYALRMYDGSYICHSAPILMIPGLADNPRVRWWLKSSSKAVISVSAITCDLQYKISGDEPLAALARLKDEFKDIITAIDIFASSSIYTYNQGDEYKKDETNLEQISVGSLSDADDMNYGFASLDGETLFTRYSNTKAVEKANVGFDSDTTHIVSLPTFSDKEVSQKMADMSAFYKIKSINIDDLKTGAMTDIEMEASVLKTLEERETLTDDTVKTHNVKYPTSMFAYNSRLNIATEKEVLYTGCSPFFCNGYNQVETSSTNGRVFAKVYIKTDDGEKTVCTSPSPAHPNAYIAYFFYPDTRAYKAELYRITEEGGQTLQSAAIEIDLQPHAMLNGAYWLCYSKGMTPIKFENSDAPSVIESGSTPWGQTQEAVTTSKLFISEVNNPFLFVSSTTVGTGAVKALCSAVKALSQGQFGQFPLYAFTDEGVWALEVSTSGTYSAKQPVTRDVCINADSITQLDSSVLFATDRGLMLIEGSQTVCLSDILNGDNILSVGSLPKMDSVAKLAGFTLGDFELIPFIDFIKDCRSVYDYTHQRIIVYNPSCTYAYIYSLKSKKWGMMQSTISDNVNSYPDALAVLTDGTLVNFSVDADGDYKGIAITRPFKLDAPDTLKTVSSIIQRGFFRKGHVQCVLYASRDLFNWFVVWSSQDHYLRGFSGTSYKYYRLALLCTLADDEELTGCSVEYTLAQTTRQS